jgi:hypothetical protein
MQIQVNVDAFTFWHIFSRASYPTHQATTATVCNTFIWQKFNIQGFLLILLLCSPSGPFIDAKNILSSCTHARTMECLQPIKVLLLCLTYSMSRWLCIRMGSSPPGRPSSPYSSGRSASATMPMELWTLIFVLDVPSGSRSKHGRATLDVWTAIRTIFLSS